MKLQAKILLTLFPLVVIPLFLLGWIAYKEIRTNAEQQSLETLRILSDDSSKLIGSKLDQFKTLAEGLARSRVVQRFTDTKNIYEKYNVVLPAMIDSLEDQAELTPELIYVRFRNDRGEQIVSIPEGAAGRSKLALNTPVHKSTRFLRIDASTTPPTYIYSIALQNATENTTQNTDVGSVSGYLEIAARLDVIDDVIDQANRENLGHVFFTDQHGRLLRDASSLDLNATQMLPEIDPYLNNEMTVMPEKIRFLDQNVYLIGHPIQDTMHMFSLLPEQQIISSSRNYYERMLGIIGISVFLFTALGFLAVRYLLIRPLNELGKAAQDIGEGNLSFKLDIKNKDELGELATSLKEMSRNLRQSNEQIRYFAYHDSLTKLPNRLMFGEYLNHALAHAIRHNQALALMYLDLDDFKVINDTLGHQAGDEVLMELSKRLAECLRAEDYLSRSDHKPSGSKSETETVARLGGDEFIIFLPNIRNPYEAATVAKRVLDALAVPFAVENRQLHVSASIGITTFPKDGTDAETLIKNADMAMYHAKDKGKNAYSYYQESMNIAAFERLNLQNELRQALSRKEFILHYQPQVNMQTGGIVSVEALIRWQHPDKGLIRPDRFIPLAEQSELIVPIGEWVINSACEQAKKWRDQGHTDICVSVNVSAAQLHRHDLREVLEEALTRHDVPPHALEIELTETAISTSEETVSKTLTAIKSLGVRIAMDDFGTGYSSLSYLSKLPIDKIKVDRSFVQHITEDSRAPIISAILAMAHSLDLPVTAEGVELQAQIDFLRDKGCGMIQGFLVSHPVEAEVISQMLNENTVLT